MDSALRPRPLSRERLRLDGRRTWMVPFGPQHRDDPDYLAWLRDYEVIKTLDLPDYLEPVSYEQVAAYCDAKMASPADLLLALYDRDDRAFIGTVKAGHIDWYAGTADIGIMIGRRDRWGKGRASDAIHTLACYLFEEVGLRRLTAGAMAVNPAMVAVFERLGFKREAVLRDQDRFQDGYCDHILFGCFPDELRAPE